MQVIVHIGVHKTGTSALQAFLERNAAALGRQGVLYRPTMAEWPNHNPLALAFRKDAPGDLGERQLETLAAAAAGRTLLLSAEMLCEAGIDIDRFLRALPGTRVTVIAYLRHPCDILVAAFSELVQHFDAQYTRAINDAPFAYDPGQFDLLARWIARDDLQLVLAPYDRRQWRDGSLFADFLAMIGASANGLDMADIRVNESLPFAAAEQLRRAVASGAPRAQHAQLRQTVRQTAIGDDPYPLTTATIAYCFDRMRRALPAFRPFLRAGFQEDYLLAPRPRGEPGGGA